MSVSTGFVCLSEKGVKFVCPFLPVVEKKENYKAGHVFTDKNSQKESKKRETILIKICRNKLFSKKLYRAFQSLSSTHIC